MVPHFLIFFPIKPYFFLHSSPPSKFGYILIFIVCSVWDTIYLLREAHMFCVCSFRGFLHQPLSVIFRYILLLLMNTLFYFEKNKTLFHFFTNNIYMYIYMCVCVCACDMINIVGLLCHFESCNFCLLGKN